MVAGANLDLDGLCLGRMRFGLYFSAFFLLLVLEFTIFHYFCNRRHRIGAYLYKIEAELLGFGNGVREGQNPKILPLGAEHPYLLCPYLMIDASNIQVISLLAEYTTVSDLNKQKQDDEAEASEDSREDEFPREPLAAHAQVCF